MATLRTYKSKGGIIYFVDFHYKGKRHRISTKTGDRKLAELFLKDIEVRIAKNRFGFDDLKRIKLDAFFDKHLRFSRATKAEGTATLDAHAQRLFRDFCGNIDLQAVSANLIEEFKVHRLRQVKATSFNLELRHLKAMFQVGVKWGLLDTNPFSHVKQVKVRHNNLPKYLTRTEVRALLEVIPPGRFKQLILFYLYTGCRRGEALNLLWDDVDLAAKRIALRQTKSGQNRVVPINNTLLAVLSEIEPDGERVFDFSTWYVTHKFKDHLKASGIKNWRIFNLHSLRHTFASHLVMSGVDLYTVSKLLGHSSVAVTQMYAHLAPDYLRVSVERLEF